MKIDISNFDDEQFQRWSKNTLQWWVKMFLLSRIDIEEQYCQGFHFQFLSTTWSILCYVCSLPDSTHCSISEKQKWNTKSYIQPIRGRISRNLSNTTAVVVQLFNLLSASHMRAFYTPANLICTDVILWMTEAQNRNQYLIMRVFSSKVIPEESIYQAKSN